MARLIRNPIIEHNLLRLKTAGDWIVAKIVLSLLALAKKLPAEKSTAVADKLGRKLAPVLPRTKIAKENLRHAFPEKSDAEVDDLARRVWGNVFQTLAEYVFLDTLFDFDPKHPNEGRVEVVGVDNFVKIRDSKKPAIIFTAHTGNWEILPIAAAAYDLNVTALFRQPNNRFIADHLLKARTTASGHLVPSRAGAAWALSDILADKGVVGLLADQAFAPGPHIQFFNRSAAANPIASTLARQYDCDIYPARCIRLPGGRFRLELLDKIDIAKTDKGEVDQIKTTQNVNTLIEGWVREHPEQWLWLHKRWKIRYPERKKWQSS